MEYTFHASIYELYRHLSIKPYHILYHYVTRFRENFNCFNKHCLNFLQYFNVVRLYQSLLLQIAYIGKNLLFLISSLNRGLVWNNNRGSLNTNAIQAVNNTKQTEKKWKTSVFDCSRLPLLLSDYSLLAACFQFVLYC